MQKLKLNLGTLTLNRNRNAVIVCVTYLIVSVYRCVVTFSGFPVFIHSKIASYLIKVI